MPTYETTDRFERDLKSLNDDERKAYRKAVKKFVDDLAAGGEFRRSLRVKSMQGASGIFEMSWAEDGRATFEYGPPVIDEEPHVIWRRVGSHAVFGQP